MRECDDPDLSQAFHHEIRFQIELANEHREFISGKKNGKINKIMQTTNVKIKFETFNEHNFLIDIAGNDASVLQGLTLCRKNFLRNSRSTSPSHIINASSVSEVAAFSES